MPKVQGNTNYEKTLFMCQVSMGIAISVLFVLLLGIFRIPASIPIFFISYRKSPKVAMIAGMIVGYISLIIKPLIIHPIVLIEAPLEYFLIALSGYFPMGIKKFKNKAIQWIYDCRGVILGTSLRFLLTLGGSYIIWSYILNSSGGTVFAIALFDEGPIFIPYLLFSMALIPFLVRHSYDVHELK